MSINLSNSYDENAEPGGFDPIPAGEYRARIIQADRVVVSRNNDYGDCLLLTWEIEGGEHDRRQVWQRLNLWGQNMRSNDQVIQIANSQFAEIREATGRKTPRDTDELLHIPCLIRVAVTQDKNKEYDPRNEVKRVRALEGGGAAGAAVDNSPRPTGSQPPAQGAQAMPWGQSSPSGATMDDTVPF